MRQTPYACASFAFVVFDEVYEFEAGETITQRYRQVIANGDWDATRVEAVEGAWQGITGAELRCASARRGAPPEAVCLQFPNAWNRPPRYAPFPRSDTH